MAVLIEAVCVVVRRDAIEARIVGGWSAFGDAVPAGAFCYDDEIASVGFMADEDAETFVGHLRSLGLRVTGEDGERDVCVVDQLGRTGEPPPWLVTSRLALEEIGGEITIAFLNGTQESRVVMPGGWTYKGSVSETPLVTVRADSPRLKHLRNQANVEVYWDEELQREVYVGRPYGPRPTGGSPLTDAQRERHNQLWEQARAIVEEQDISGKVPPFKPGFFESRKLRKASALLDEVLTLHPGNVSALWIQGKILQLFGEFEPSLDRFAKACLIDPSNPNVAREAGISATEAGKLDVAVYFAQEALKATPGDAGLRTNLAVAHLFAGNVSAARFEIEDARAAEPDDPITHSVWALVREVAEGRMRRPSKTSEIDGNALRAAMRQRP